MTEFDARAQAVAESRFFAHLAVYAVSTAVLLGINLVMGPDPLWAGWVALAWGLVVLSHAGSVFGLLLGDDWVRRRTAVLRGGMSENEVYQILDEVMRVRSVPVGTAQTLRQLQKRVDEIETTGVAPAQASAPDLDPFDLDAAQAVGRPISPEAIGARPATVDDPFADARDPIETPVLDAPRRRGRRS